MAALLGGSPALIAQSSLPAEFNRAREIKSVRPTRNLKSIRVVSWNIDRGSRFGLVSSGLEHAAADLCLLQEVDWNTRRAGKRDVAADLARDLHLNMAYGIEFEELGQESGGPAFIGQATLTRLPILRSRLLRFRRQSGFWKPRGWIPSSIPLMQRRVGNRLALVTELEFDGRPLVVYNVHLESRSLGKIQNLQLDEILADLRKYPPDTAAILGGDLNTKYFPAKFLRKLESAGFRSATGERIERTHAIAMTLDWIFVKGPVRIEDGRVRRDIRGSDHYPVYAEVLAQ
jgi:endonuclease/exonuclease/phosphatase family metal-dependent hydrolase